MIMWDENPHVLSDGVFPYLLQHQLKVFWSEVICSRLNIKRYV